MAKTKDERGPLGWALLRAREALKPARTQGEIAGTLGIAQATICSWEAGETMPRADRLDDVADAYELRPERLKAIWFAVASRKAAA